jgi:hypothetical protein
MSNQAALRQIAHLLAEMAYKQLKQSMVESQQPQTQQKVA